MKTLTKALLFGFSLGLANIAAAEHFNDKSTWVTSNNYPEPPSRAENYAAVSDHFNERSGWAPVVPSEGPALCSVNPSWSKASTDPYQLADRFNDKYSNRC